MRSLKKLITSLLAVVMILTSVGIPAFAASFSDITDEKVAVAVDKLVAHSIITGYEDGTFKPDNQITRAEFAAIVTRMKGVTDNLGTDAVTGFSDLDNDASRAWARPYVKAAVDLKIINGFEDGTFRAGEPVTYEQAVKMLVCAVGYEVVAQSELSKIKITNPNATWSAGYIAAANKHGITKGVITNLISEPASRGVVAVLTSNGLDVPEIKENEDGTFEKVDPEETEKNITEIKGLVSGTYYTGIDSDNVNISEIELMIGTGSDKNTYELAEKLRGTIDLNDIIGKYVVAYYDNIDRQITSITERNNTSVIIDEASIHNISGDTIRYYKENGSLETVSLSGYTVIHNGKYVSSIDLESEFKNGTIELLTAGGNKFAKVTTYEVFVVSSYDKTNEKIFFKYKKTFDNGDGTPVNYYQFPNRTSDKPEIYVNGVKKEFSSLSLSAYNVINYMESPDGASGNEIKKMYVTTGSKSGKVTAGLGEERKVELDNKEMYLTNDYVAYSPTGNDEEKAPFELGDSYTYYLDYTGQIAAVKYSAASNASNYSYGYIIAAGDDRDGNPAVKIFTSSNSVATYKLKSSVKVDGDKTSDDNVIGKLEDAAATLNSNYNTAFGTTPTAVCQPVKYSVSGGQIDSIDTVATVSGGTDDSFTYDGKLNGTSKNATTTKTTVKISGTTYAMNTSTIVIYVPDTRSNEDAYSKMSASTAFATTTEAYAEVFGVDSSSSNKLAKMVLVYGNDPTLDYIGDSPYMVVTKVSGSTDGDQITGYVKDSESTSTVTVSEDKFRTNLSDNAVTAAAVEKGDIIRYLKDSSGKVIAIEMVYDASAAGKLTEGALYSDTTGDPDFRARYGEVVARYSDENTISVTTALKAEGADTDAANNAARTYSTSSSKVLILTTSGDVETTTLDSIYDISTETPSRVIVISRYDDEKTAATVIYIVK